jgi:hypothetical protein
MSDNIIGFPHTWKSDYSVDYEAQPDVPTEVNPNEVEPEWLPRQLIIIEAEQAITGARHQTHGSAETNLECTGELWAVYDKYARKEADGNEVALKNILQKISRIICGEGVKDHYKDIIGWAALAWERSEDGNVG